MVNLIKHKYYTYKSGEFLPIFEGGKLATRKQFHLYKLNRALDRVDNAWMGFIERTQTIN